MLAGETPWCPSLSPSAPARCTLGDASRRQVGLGEGPRPKAMSVVPRGCGDGGRRILGTEMVPRGISRVWSLEASHLLNNILNNIRNDGFTTVYPLWLAESPAMNLWKMMEDAIRTLQDRCVSQGDDPLIVFGRSRSSSAPDHPSRHRERLISQSSWASERVVRITDVNGLFGKEMGEPRSPKGTIKSI